MSLAHSARRLVKHALPYRQTLAAYHRIRNRRTLTVVVFHRVLPRDDPRWPDALPEWTVSDDIFERCLHFFQQHYHVLSLEQLLSAHRAGDPLPPRSLLITFDDGYADNAEYALPLLRRSGLPAVLFVTSSFLDRRTRPWCEDLASAYRQGTVSDAGIAAIHRVLFPAPNDSRRDAVSLLGEIVAEYAGLSDGEADAICVRALGQPLQRFASPAQMITAEQLRALHAGSVAIAAHGRTHISLPRSPDLASELEEPRRTLAAALELPSDSIRALAFPYGDYSSEVVARAFAAGYQLLFTFTPGLTRLPGGRLASRVIDRLNVSGPALAPDGVTNEERLARYFFVRAFSRTPVEDR